MGCSRFRFASPRLRGEVKILQFASRYLQVRLQSSRDSVILLLRGPTQLRAVARGRAFHARRVGSASEEDR